MRIFQPRLLACIFAMAGCQSGDPYVQHGPRDPYWDSIKVWNNNTGTDEDTPIADKQRELLRQQNGK